MKIQTDQPIFHNRTKITKIITEFWDKTSEGWRTVWGPHIHHGYYENNESLTPLAAQEKLIDKLATHLDIAPHSHILDVGCGMGGASIYLSQKYHAMVTGITLSQKQVAIATQQAQTDNVKNVFFKVEDALLLNSFSDASVDIVWSLESCEQFYDKALFIQQAFRVLKPGGKLMLATWCSASDEYLDKAAHHYRKLCLAFDLPYMPTIPHYQSLLEQRHFIVKDVLNWSSYVEKSWDIGLSLANAFSFFQQLKLGSWRGVRFVKQIHLMREAFAHQRVKYGVFFAIKPL